MKKICSILACLSLIACTSTHQGTKSLNVEGLSLRAKPLSVSIIPGEKISGSARCKSFLGIEFSSPSKEAFGARLETNQGNFAGDTCTRGAIYDAIVSSDADIILSPQYRATRDGFLCLPWIGCLYSDTTITVTGHKGTYNYINETPVYETTVYETPMYGAPMYETPVYNTVEAPVTNTVDRPLTDISDIPIYVIK